MDLLDDPPPATATQILHDEPQKSKPITETTKPSNHTNENIASSKKVTTSTTTKIKRKASFGYLQKDNEFDLRFLPPFIFFCTGNEIINHTTTFLLNYIRIWIVKIN